MTELIIEFLMFLECGKNTANSLHGGATAALVDILGSAAIYTTKLASPGSGVSVEISVSYVDAAYAGVCISIFLYIRLSVLNRSVFAKY